MKKLYRAGNSPRLQGMLSSGNLAFPAQTKRLRLASQTLVFVTNDTLEVKFWNCN